MKRVVLVVRKGNPEEANPKGLQASDIRKNYKQGKLAP